METTQVQATGNQSRKKWIYVAIGLIFGLAMVVGAVALLPARNTNDDSNDQQEGPMYIRTNGIDDDVTEAATAARHQFFFKNQCTQTVWVGALNNPGKVLPGNGGWRQPPGSEAYLYLPVGWAGRFWGRTGCDASGHCQTGDCGNRIQCNGAGGVPPVTLAEFTLDSNADWYDVSLVDGYNLPMRIQPLPNSYRKVSNNMYDCGIAGCNSDLNVICPAELQQKNSAGKVVACLSACEKYNTDQYCCRGSFGTPQTCPATHYSETFKSACPGAYSYAYDDPTSTFTCHGNPATNYLVTFCPEN